MTHRPTLADVGERGLLARIARWVGPAPEGVLGVGDDAALVPVVRDTLLLTTDVQVEGTHFLKTWSRPGETGYKALAVNVSDAAAMGGRPSYVLLSLILPPGVRVDAVKRLYDGFKRLGRKEGIPILGGNVARGSEVSITVFLMGSVPRSRPLLRTGSAAGDRLYVSGYPGLAYLGRKLLEARGRGRSRRTDLWEEPGTGEPAWRRSLARSHAWGRRALRRFLTPEPRPSLTRDLRLYRPTSLIDVSDGLVPDLHHLSGGGLRIEIDPSRLPMTAGFRSLAEAVGEDPQASILHGGEDYELMFTLSPGAAGQFGPRGWLSGVPVTEIGGVTEGKAGVYILTEQGPRVLSREGFEHFSRQRQPSGGARKKRTGGSHTKSNKE